MKIFLRILMIMAAIILLVSTGGMIYVTQGLKAGAQVEVGSIDLAKTEDGIYSGKYSSGRWTNELYVTVKDHRITQIEVIKDVGVSNPELTKQLFSRIIEKQDTDIDVISGATVTCKAYLKSVENALKQ